MFNLPLGNEGLFPLSNACLRLLMTLALPTWHGGNDIPPVIKVGSLGATMNCLVFRQLCQLFRHHCNACNTLRPIAFCPYGVGWLNCFETIYLDGKFDNVHSTLRSINCQNQASCNQLLF